MKNTYKESSRKNYGVRVDELRSLGYPRTDIELVDMCDSPAGKTIWYYEYVRCGHGVDDIPANLCKGHITFECRGTPIAHVIKDLTHDEFVEIAESIIAYNIIV